MNRINPHKKILIAPLDWGLGHAARCIVIIHDFKTLNCNITVAASGTIKKILQTEFPDINFLELPGYNISYSKFKRTLPLKILIQIPKVLKIISFENKWLAQIVKVHQFDAVISDNRFGLFTKECKSVFITHQLQIKTNFFLLDKMIQFFNYNYINRFNECWVPDLKDEPNVSGELSHPEKLPAAPVKYLGPFSRFNKINNKKIQFKWMAIISGPEPQRSIFEKKIFHVASKIKEAFIVIRGLPGEKENDFLLENCKVFNHLNTNDMQEAMLSSEFIVSRCGYTTVMEVLSLQKKSIFIPTPGQTEQEYLARHLLKQNWSYTFKQEDNFETHFKRAESFQYFFPEINMQQHKTVVTDFINALP